MSQKYFFDFRSPDLPFDIRFRTRGFFLVMRSRKAGLPCATRARKRELSIQEGRIENDSAKNFLRQNFFSKPLFSTIYVTLIIMSRRYLFDFRSPDLPFDIRFRTRGFLLVMRSRKAGLPCNTSSEAGALDTGGTYREWLGQKFSKTKFFLKTTFFHDVCHPDHYEPKIFFRFFKSGPEGFPIMSVIVR